MSAPKQEGTIVFVDDEAVMRSFLSLRAQEAGVRFVVLEDADNAVATLKELGKDAGMVFSDGLNGDWKKVVTAALEVDVPATVVSANIDIQPEVEEAGALFVSKVDLPANFIQTALAELGQPVAAEA